MVRVWFALLVASASLLPGSAVAGQEVEASAAHTRDVVSSTEAQAEYYTSGVEEFCVVFPTLAVGTKGGFLPDGDPVYGHEAVVGNVACPKGSPARIALAVIVEYFAEGLWKQYSIVLCQNEVQGVPTTVPPCVVVNHPDPGSREDPADWVGKCRRARFRLQEPSGHPDVFAGVWGCGGDVDLDLVP